MSVKIALAGNPNCGKTTLFNALTGSNQFVGNWPGVTVEKKEGKLKGHKDVIIMDLPGIYSLSPYTSKKDSVSKQRMYLMWDDLLSRVDNFPDKQKDVFIQAVSEIVASFGDEVRNIDKGILHVLTKNILLLRKQKIELFIDAAGYLSFSLVNIESEEQMVEIEEK